MANSYQRATSDGTMTFIDVSITYLDRSEISVYFDDILSTEGVDWDWSGVDDKRILFPVPVPNGVVVMVKRITDASQLRHEFSRGAAFTASTLDEDLKQALHMAQEASEANLVGDFFTDINMHGSRVYNLGTAVDDSDALTLAQYKADADGAFASKTAAEAAQVAAEAAAASAGSAVSAFAAQLLSSIGSTLVGWVNAGTGAVYRTLQSRLRDTVHIEDFGADMTGATPSDAAATAAIDYLVSRGGGILDLGIGTLLFNGTASGVANPDAYLNGIKLPDTNGNFLTLNGIRLRAHGTATILKAGSDNMVMVRASRSYSGGSDFKIDGNGKANVIGLLVGPESMVQTTELVSNSFQSWSNLQIENCAEGTIVQPGPTVTGSDSGCFYQTFSNIATNLCTRALWLKPDVTGNGNRVTRSTFDVKAMRGNTGVQVDAGTELKINLWAEFMNTGATPNATPVAFLQNNSNALNLCITGYAEACSRGLVLNTTAAPYTNISGWGQSTARDSSLSFANEHTVGRLNIGKLAGLTGVISIADPSFVALVGDPDMNGQKTLEVQTNGVGRMRWFNGVTTHKGSSGDISMDAAGSTMAFTTTGNMSMNYASTAALLNIADSTFWRSGGGVDAIRLAATGTRSLFPASDNTILLGQSGFRWSAVWSANGTIQTSDPRTKKDIVDSELGLDFINRLRPVSYRFIVGGNEIVGVRETKPATYDAEGVLLTEAETENIVQPKPGKRKHFGFLTTEVKEALQGVDFGGYIKTNPDDPESEEALRYDEFISPLVRAVQELSAMVERQQLEIEELKRK